MNKGWAVGVDTVRFRERRGVDCVRIGGGGEDTVRVGEWRGVEYVRVGGMRVYNSVLVRTYVRVAFFLFLLKQK